jgi:hypothetical protein
MKLAGRWFIFIFFFTVEVRVKASELIERPQGCLNQKSTCALQTKDDVFHYSNPQLEFHLGKDSLSLKHSSNELEFASGALWVARYEKMNVKTIYGSVNAKNGPFWVLQGEEKIWIRNVNGDLKVKVRDGREVELPIGFQIWIGGVDSNGQSTMGIPETIHFDEHIRLWSRLFPGTKEKFKDEVESVKFTWGPVAERAAELYTNMALRQRRIAEARAAELERRRLAVEEERRMFREMYVKKVFWR